MIRKAIIILFVALIVLSLGACGIRRKIDEKISEKITEGVVSKIAGDNVDIDLDDGGFTIKGDDGEEFTFGTTDWPKGKAADLLPEPKGGIIVSVMNSDNSCMVMMEEVDEKACKKYIEELKDKGFNKDVYESADEHGMAYHAGLDDNTVAQVLYTLEDKSFSIGVQINE